MWRGILLYHGLQPQQGYRQVLVTKTSDPKWGVSPPKYEDLKKAPERKSLKRQANLSPLVILELTTNDDRALL